MADAKDVGQRLKAIRTMLGLTELLMAERLKEKATTWNAVESGLEALPVAMAEKLVDTTPGLRSTGFTAGRPLACLWNCRAFLKRASRRKGRFSWER
jgi:transcriptional regulator with XRE-family HTH domain